MIVVAIKYRLNAFGFFATFKTKCQAVNDEDKKLY
jgi:carboxylesterase type B